MDKQDRNCENCNDGVFIPAVTDYFKSLLEKIKKDKKEKDDTRGN